jgi:hypothetical protein
LSTRAGERHPASNVAATNRIGMMLRILERFNVQCCFSNSPCSRAYGIRLANFNQVFSSQKKRGEHCTRSGRRRDFIKAARAR